MDNVVLTSATQISPDSGSPINPQPVTLLTSEPETTTTTAVESLVSNPMEPVEQTAVDGNVQAHMDINYQAHDVALAAAKTNGGGGGHEQTNGFKLSDNHKMEIDDGYEHTDKMKSRCSRLNKLFLILAIGCFALFLCSIAFIVANLDGLNDKHGRSLSRIPYPYPISDMTILDKQINSEYFNITHPNPGGIIVVVTRFGAGIKDILIPYTNDHGKKQYRSIVLKNNENFFGKIRFGFDNLINSYNMTNELPFNYPYLKYNNENWTMYGDLIKPYRVRFVNGLIEVIYELSSSNNNELIMTTIVSTQINEQIIVDPTNNIYFNLRGYGDLSTHYLNLSLSTPINIQTTEQIQKNQLMQGQSLNNLTNIVNYFYKFNRAGIGKNHIATLTESETKTTVDIFADHTGAIIDPFGVGMFNESGIHMNGIRISPRQSPVYQTTSLYGPTLVVYPSQAIHTTWWQFEY